MNEVTDDYPGDGNHSTDTLLIEAMREYQAEIDAGRAPERSAFLARHPAVTHELADCLDGFRYLHNLLPIAEPAVATGVPLGDFQIVPRTRPRRHGRRLRSGAIVAPPTSRAQGAALRFDPRCPAIAEIPH